MMETFIVLGLCFILYEALDFFQGCMHSVTPNTTDQIDAYRRQLDEQRQQQQQEQFLANLSPLLGAQLLTASSNSTTPSGSTASIISDQLRAQQQRELLEPRQPTAAYDSGPYSASTPALNGGGIGAGQSSARSSAPHAGLAAGVGGGSDSGNGGGAGGGFRPAHRSVYESQELYATSSLPRDYYYLQQQQLKNKNSSRSLLSKLGASSSDNRIFPEAPAVLGVPAGVITTQPTLSGNAIGFDCLPPAVVPASPLALDLKRAILTNNNNNKNYNNDSSVQKSHAPSVEQQNQKNLKNRAAASVSAHENATSLASSSAASTASSDSEDSSSDSSDSASGGSASLASCTCDSDQEAADERDFAVGSCASVHADFREIECERLRRKSVSVKRIYSISEKF